ncbi:hypothetical protein OAP13_00715 [Gammaproteobacteria bacterium]|nr:hypothetical protein [Gammaproteobacteria bacterium]
MNLTFSKSRFFGRIYALSMGLILLLISGFFFFDLLASHSGSDFSNNLRSTESASQGLYWTGSNSPNSIYAYLVELHYYYWLGFLSNLFENKEYLLRGITLFVTFMLIYPTLFSASQLRNKSLLFALLFVLFMHPRFLDLVIGNIRSASALVFVFYALRVKGTKLKYLLMAVGASFHLGVLAPIFLHLLHQFWKMLPKRFSYSQLTFLLPFMAPGILILAAKLIFPDRGGGEWEGGLLYTTMVFILAAYTFFIAKSKFNNEIVFISLGLISLVIWGSLLGYSTMRYFSFFFPFFAAMILLYDRKPQVLMVTFVLWLLFTIASHSTWVLSL